MRFTVRDYHGLWHSWWRWMNDYSEIGRAKLEMQANDTLEFIRCPLDSAAMLVERSVACRYERGQTIYREFKGLPRGDEWTVENVVLQCSACRRQADDIRVHAPVAAGSKTLRR